MKSDELIDAEFTSVWDGGIEITTKCRVNMGTKEVMDISVQDLPSSVLELFEILDREYVTINDKEYPVFGTEAKEVGCFWYK